MKPKQRKLSTKWTAFAVLILLGLLVLLFCPGYDFTGLMLLGLGALIPTYHLIGLLADRHLTFAKVLHMSLSIFLGLFFLAMVSTCGTILSSSRGTPDPDADHLVVLGAGVNGTTPSRSLRERLDAALGYLKDHPASVAIVSGGQGAGEDITEAQCMYDYLTSHGISPDRVWQEDQATSTLENLRFSLDLIRTRTGTEPTKIAIVSSEYHLHRASMFARWLDLEAQTVPARTGILPLRWNYYLREIFAVWYYSLFGG